VTEDRTADQAGDPAVEVGGGQTPEPLPDDVARAALRGDPEAEALVEKEWDRAKSMEGEAPTG
jgi:hypothetical protein